MSDFEKSPHRTRFARSVRLQDRLLFLFIALVIALTLLAIRELNDLPALGAGDKPCDAKRVAGLGVGQPRNHGAKNENAVESILSRPFRWSASWCGFGGTGVLQRLATAVATKPQAAPRCSFWKFPGITVPHVGADGLGIRESNTAFGYFAHAAPGALSAFPQPDSSAVETTRGGLSARMCVKEIESVGLTAVRFGTDQVSGNHQNDTGSGQLLPIPSGADRPSGLFSGREHA
jgi:hypothetical protein